MAQYIVAWRIENPYTQWVWIANPDQRHGTEHPLGREGPTVRTSAGSGIQTSGAESNIRGVGDINGNLRCRQGYIDLGCYESNHPVSINDIQLPTITLLPNPATTHLTVTGLQSPSIEIYDLKGRCLITTRSNQEATSINISSLPAGLYLLKSGNHTAKFIKQ